MSATVKLSSKENEVFEVEEGVAFQSATVRTSLEDILENSGDRVVPLLNVSGKTLAKVLEYCKYHFEATKEGATNKSAEEILQWDNNFLSVDQATLFDLILAANYLDIKSLLDLTCKSVADMITGKTPAEIRDMFNIKNDLTPEDEDRLRNEIEWKFE